MKSVRIVKTTGAGHARRFSFAHVPRRGGIVLASACARFRRRSGTWPWARVAGRKPLCNPSAVGRAILGMVGAIRFLTGLVGGWLGSGLLPAAPAFTNITTGLSYAHVQKSEPRWSIHIARVNRTAGGFAFRTTLAQGRIFGLATVPEQVAAASGDHFRPWVAVNGDFFVITPGPYQGDPLGLQIIGGELISAPSSFCWWVEPDGRMFIEELTPRFGVVWPDGGRTPFGLNEAPRTNGLVLYTPALGTTTRNRLAPELVLTPLTGWPNARLQANREHEASVRRKNPTGDTPLDRRTWALAVGPTWQDRFEKTRFGDRMRIETRLSHDLSCVPAALGGWPRVVHRGDITVTPPSHAKSAPRHPRTAVGFNDQYLFLVVVDGRQPELSVGMTMLELARFMSELGCTEALNLDGGGSSTFWLDGTIRNSPSDGRPRPVANALVVGRREPPGR